MKQILNPNTIYRWTTLVSLLDPQDKLSDKNKKLLAHICLNTPTKLIVESCGYSSQRSLEVAISKNVSPLLMGLLKPMLQEKKCLKHRLGDKLFVEIEQNMKNDKIIPKKNWSELLEQLGFKLPVLENIDSKVYSAIDAIENSKTFDPVEFIADELNPYHLLQKLYNLASHQITYQPDLDKLHEWDEHINFIKSHCESTETEAIEKLVLLCEKNKNHGLILERPGVVIIIGALYFKLERFVDCIAVLDFALSLIKKHRDKEKYELYHSTYLALSLCKMLYKYSDKIQDDRKYYEHFYTIYQQIRILYESTFTAGRRLIFDRSICITPKWNLISFELSLIKSYSGSALEEYNYRIESACMDLRALIYFIEKENVDLSEVAKQFRDDANKALQNLASKPHPEMINLIKEFKKKL
jgi:hypothetical protein